MDLEIKNKYFVVTGATSGFGRAVTEALINEGAYVIANARREQKLNELQDKYPKKIIKIHGDVQEEAVRNNIVKKAIKMDAEGVFVNAGGPPAGGSLEVSIDEVDQAYNLVLRWKIDFTQKLIPYFIKKKYGRMVFLESSSIKQPIDNLVLSNSLRMAVAGYVKTLANEMANKGITLNILAPGFHDTDAVNRIFDNKAKLTGISAEEIRIGMINNTPVQKMGKPGDLASLAIWLLSPKSGFVTGQTYTLDGGVVKGN